MRAITDAQLEHIYKTGYWDKCQCDALPDGVDYVVFDQAVNSGPGQSVKWLQAAVGVAVDGAIGPQTIAAALQRPPGQVINAMCDARLAFCSVSGMVHCGRRSVAAGKHVSMVCRRLASSLLRALWQVQNPCQWLRTQA